jgi:ABC-type nitrate/sulfonate/bicarbonate transport system ATPase subunit
MIEINNLSKIYSDQYGNKVKLFEDVSFQIDDNKLTAIIAPVGSGKSSLLKILSGLEKQSSGDIKKDIDGKIVFIPSEPSSFPWLSVWENIIYGLEEVNNERINELINLVGLEGYDEHYPANKSIGFRFRVSLARSLAHNPCCICIDEPFNRMDQITRIEIYRLIRKINKETNSTILLATTNITEAIYLSNIILLMGGEPSTIITGFKIDLPPSQDIFNLSSNEFNNYINEVENNFKKVDSKKVLYKSI